MWRLRFCTFPLLLSIGLCPTQAQQSQKTDDQLITFTSITNLVLVPVIVTDKQGKGISGLKSGDFTLLEDGKPR